VSDLNRPQAKDIPHPHTGTPCIDSAIPGDRAVPGLLRTLGAVLASMAVLVVLLTWLAGIETRAARLHAGTGVDPFVESIVVAADVPISDTRPGHGVAKTIYHRGAAAITVTFGISGTSPLTLSTGAAFGEPVRTFTSTLSPWTVDVTYSVEPGPGHAPGVLYTATNASGVQTIVPVTYVRDVMAPVAAILHPSAPTWISGTLVLTGTASDGGGAGVGHVEVLTQTGVPWDTAVGTDLWTYTWTPPAGQNGTPYTLAVRALDYLGLVQSPVASRVITVDNLMTDAPSALTSTSHTTSTWSNRSTVTDDGMGSGLGGYASLWNETPDTVPPAIRDLAATTTMVTAVLTDGTAHAFHLRPVDCAGNWGPAQHLGPFWIDTRHPLTPTLRAPTSGTLTNTTTVHFDWSDVGERHRCLYLDSRRRDLYGAHVQSDGHPLHRRVHVDGPGARPGGEPRPGPHSMGT